MNDLRTFEENTVGMDYFVGDIHGCYDQLMCKLGDLGFNFETDRLFSVGDLIDRGEKNVECIELLEQPWFFAVRGNHDQFMIDYVERGQVATWVMNGGIWAYQLTEDELIDYYHILKDNTPLAMEIPYKGKKVGVIHANVTSGVWGDFDEQRDIWDRTRTRIPGVYNDIQGIDVVVVGHTVLGTPVWINNVFHIDTGCVFGYDLTIKSIEEVLNVDT